MWIRTDEVGLVGGWKMLHSNDPEMGGTLTTRGRHQKCSQNCNQKVLNEDTDSEILI
jgi:hypothetical protein